MKRLVLVLALAAAWLAAQEHKAPEHGGAAAEAHGEAKGGGGHHADESTQMWKWIDFLILAGLIGYGLTKAGPAFRSRAESIRRSLEDAREVKAEAEARAAALTAKLGNLDAELAGLRANAKHEMEAEAQRIGEETRRMAARLEEQARLEVASMTKAAEAGLKAEAARLSLELAEQKVKARMNAETQGALVGRFVSGLRRAVNS